MDDGDSLIFDLSDSSTNGIYTLMRFGSAIEGFIDSAFSTDALGKISIASDGMSLIYTVPESATISAIFGMIALGIVFWRKR